MTARIASLMRVDTAFLTNSWVQSTKQSRTGRAERMTAMKTDFKIGDHVFLSKDTARAWGHDEKWVQRYGNRVYTVTRVGSAETMRSIYAHCVLDGIPGLLLPANELNEVNEYNFKRLQTWQPDAEDSKTVGSAINHPDHYNHGIEAIDFIESHELNFNRGNAVKYITRAGLKDKGKEVEDLEKAVWYLQHEIARLKKEG